uniref:Uncharacterized protein n=1 Tax=Eutreptiella gymnastica TaxID=73025 RepID=A0A7S1N6F8_9EUGL|mmetsp:Transcript_128820/g.222580  ORF Transcript_128820/g.222580 Transcript_128820/m.222580 type:complete len:822 (+) Transcript_128820:186-2651(+)
MSTTAKVPSIPGRAAWGSTSAPPSTSAVEKADDNVSPKGSMATPSAPSLDESTTKGLRLDPDTQWGEEEGEMDFSTPLPGMEVAEPKSQPTRPQQVPSMRPTTAPAAPTQNFKPPPPNIPPPPSNFPPPPSAPPPSHSTPVNIPPPPSSAPPDFIPPPPPLPTEPTTTTTKSSSYVPPHMRARVIGDEAAQKEAGLPTSNPLRGNPSERSSILVTPANPPQAKGDTSKISVGSPSLAVANQQQPRTLYDPKTSTQQAPSAGASRASHNAPLASDTQPVPSYQLLQRPKPDPKSQSKQDTPAAGATYTPFQDYQDLDDYGDWEAQDRQRRKASREEPKAQPSRRGGADRDRRRPAQEQGREHGSFRSDRIELSRPQEPSHAGREAARKLEKSSTRDTQKKRGEEATKGGTPDWRRSTKGGRTNQESWADDDDDYYPTESWRANMPRTDDYYGWKDSERWAWEEEERRRGKRGGARQDYDDCYDTKLEHSGRSGKGDRSKRDPEADDEHEDGGGRRKRRGTRGADKDKPSRPEKTEPKDGGINVGRHPPTRGKREDEKPESRPVAEPKGKRGKSDKVSRGDDDDDEDDMPKHGRSSTRGGRLKDSDRDRRDRDRDRERDWDRRSDWDDDKERWWGYGDRARCDDYDDLRKWGYEREREFDRSPERERDWDRDRRGPPSKRERNRGDWDTYHPDSRRRVVQDPWDYDDRKAYGYAGERSGGRDRCSEDRGGGRRQSKEDRRRDAPTRGSTLSRSHADDEPNPPAKSAGGGSKRSSRGGGGERKAGPVATATEKDPAEKRGTSGGGSGSRSGRGRGKQPKYIQKA